VALSRIERLPDDLVDKIAAGEVVERPASVVKELVENSLDAGAATVRVEIEGGGRRLMRVRDDGCGMGPEDARLALERHATSKLRALSDLQAIGTNGFRGEALPSIASVSHLLLRTRDESGPAGTEVEVKHGQLVGVRAAGHPRGTTVEVRDLFGTVPARRKFLRSDATESAHVAEAVSALALARPGTGFALASGGRTAIEAPPVDGLAARLYQLFGGQLLEDLVAVEGGLTWVEVRGFVSRLDRAGQARTALRLFVNGRGVKDRAISKAVLDAYRAAGGGGQRPEAFLFLTLPLHTVDVNVHPAKSEVRFADPRLVWRAVGQAVSDALSAGAGGAGLRDQGGAVMEATERYLACPEPEGGRQGSFVSVASQGPDRPAAPEPQTQAGLLPSDVPRVLGQHRNTYIVASDGEDLVLVDQHTAHERVRFEALLVRLERREVEAQVLLAPLVLDLAPELRPVLEANQAELAELGFEVEGFGGGSLQVRAVPALLGTKGAGGALTELLRDLLERETAEWTVSGRRERLAATLACHSAVRAGQPLTVESMSAILRELAQTAHPTLCPHGRPTSVRLPRGDVARWFGRTGWRRQ
jgi:DNA mismatch repair protein MutL